MEFLNTSDGLYHAQKIIFQHLTKKELYIITLDKATGKYNLWLDNKKIGTGKSPVELEEKIEE